MIPLKDAELVVVVGLGVGIVLLFFIAHAIASLLSNGEDVW